MPKSDGVDGVLITGVYGTGKSSLAAEIAETLERRDVSYGAVDLDWLTWFHVVELDRAAARRIYLDNVARVVRNYREIGVRHLVLAGAVRDRDEVRALEAAAEASLRVVRLEVPLVEITRRLQPDPTSGRRDDLEVATEWLAGSVGVGIEDLVASNAGPDIEDLAAQIIRWLGWDA
jgi:adenylylsulfate kinase-like enzyme